MKYMLDFPGGYNYGFPRNLKQGLWYFIQDDREQFDELLSEYNVPEHKREDAWLWARWYKDDTEN